MSAVANSDPFIDSQPVGEVVRGGDTEHGYATATFDATKKYRYRLSRIWEPSLPRLAFCMLNPSTADERVLDPTVRRCWGYAQSWQAGSLEIVNVFAYRSTDPRALKQVADPVGEHNDKAIIAAGQACDLLVVAWGTHAHLHNRAQKVRELLAREQIPAVSLALTKDGQPRHPLYLPAQAWPQWWPDTGN